jgi:hypothetical protein
MSKKTGNILRILAIVLVAATAVFTLLGGVGTTCVAFNADQYGKAFAAFIPYAPTYQMFVYTSVLAGLVGLAATVAMVRGYSWAYWGAVVAAVAGLATAGVHMVYSSTLKGISFFAAAPENMRFYVSVVTLVVLLLLRLPGAWQAVDFTKPWRGKGTKSIAGGLTAIVMGTIALSTPIWAAPNHVVDGYNLVYVLELPLVLGGWASVLMGLILVARPGLALRGQRLLGALGSHVAAAKLP